MEILDLIGRERALFVDDLSDLSGQLSDIVESSAFLVIGGAGSIGQSIVDPIFQTMV